MNCKRKQLIYVLIGMFLIMGMGFGELNFVVSAQNSITDSPQIFIDSRFKLWDINEKMLDKDFNVSIIYNNISVNNSFTYSIIIDNEIYSGNATYYHFQNFTIINTDIILKFEIIVNNETVLSETGIVISTGISKADIDSIREPFTINLNPRDWSKKEWNIFFALIFSGLLGLVISYKLVKRIRKKYGVKTIR